MINPISSVSQGMSGAAPLNEAVLRFGASQESREQQRQERVSADERVEAPIDQATIDCSDDLPDDSATPQQGAQTQGAGENRASHHNHRAGDENAVNQRAPGQDDQQREAVLARHATEHQGKHEQHVDRSQRSTREMMGRVETSRAIDETAMPADAAKTAADDEGSSMVSSAKGSDASSAGPVDDSSGGSDSGPVAAPVVSSGSAAPRIGGDVLAAAVHSGITTTEEIAPGSAQSDDKVDDNAQDVDSSQEARLDRQEQQGKKAGRQRSLDGGTDFHDGDGGRDEQNHQRFQSGGQQQQHDRRPPRDETPQGDSVAPWRRTLGEVDPNAVTVADPASTARSHAEVAALSAEAAASEGSASGAAADTQTETSAASSAAAGAVPLASASAPPHQPAPSAATAAASSQPPTAQSPETFERTAVLSPGLDLLGGGDEYFFFDDARLPEPPAAAS